MTQDEFDWSGVLFIGEWTPEEALAFARRVEEIAKEERAKKEAADAAG